MIRSFFEIHGKRFVLTVSVALILLMIAALISMLFLKDTEKDDSISVVLSWQDNSTEISLYKTEECSYFLLPSYQSLSGCTLCINDGYRLKIGDKIYSNGDDVSEVMNISEGNISLLKGEREVFSSKLQILKAENISTVHINTQSGNMDYIHENKENKETADMLFVSADGSVIYDGALDYVKGRGNKPYKNGEKNSYNIKLNKATDLMSMGKNKRWALVANTLDQSGIRNKLIYDFAKEAGLSYTPDCQIVDLYLNGQYVGTYTLSERIETGEGRVEIDNLEEITEGLNKVPMDSVKAVTETNRQYYEVAANPQNITGGYIIELEFSTRYKDESSWFITDGGLAVVFSSPEYVSKEQMEYVSSLVQEFEDALNAQDGINPNTGKSWEEYIDVTSWAEKYLIEEIFCNQDTEWSSQYLYIKKDERKIYAGPVWDYDLSMGNGHSCLENPNTLVSTWRGRAFDSYAHWLPKLLEQDVFMGEVKRIYAEIMRPLCDKYIQKIDAYAAEYKASASMNDFIWYVNKNAATEDIAKLKEYFISHIAFLDSLWIDGEDYVFITFATVVPKEAAWLYAVKRGEAFAEIPVQESVEGDEFLGWFIEETGERYTSEITVTKDTRIIGKWKSQEE